MSDPLNECDWITDNYEHPTANIFYSVTSLPGNECPEDFYEYFSLGCLCEENTCSDDTCSCLKFGTNYEKNLSGNLILQMEKLLNLPIFECNRNCKCFSTCKKESHCLNRCIQFGPLKDLEVFQTTSKGLGLRSQKFITSGSFICEYAGEIISLKEAKRRLDINLKNIEMNYVFILKEHLSDGKVMETCVDPKYVGNIGRYINHSCNPNSVIVPIRVNCLVPKLCIFAICDIESGSEICYDYSGHIRFYGRDECSTHLGREELSTELSHIPCGCKESNCRKFLPFSNDL